MTCSASRTTNDDRPTTKINTPLTAPSDRGLASRPVPPPCFRSSSTDPELLFPVERSLEFRREFGRTFPDIPTRGSPIRLLRPIPPPDASPSATTSQRRLLIRRSPPFSSFPWRLPNSLALDCKPALPL